MRIQPARRVQGTLSLPGDKAISHRAAIVAALARGSSRIENFSTSEDCRATLSCLEALGVGATVESGAVTIEGVGLEGLRAPRRELDCRNSGSTMRMLAGVLAGQNFESVLVGDASLMARPMKRIIEPLEQMGARVEAEEARAPVRIIGRKPLRPISYRMPVASAQVKSCILLAGLYARGSTRVIEALGATRDHTERMLRWYGANVTESASEEEKGAAHRIEILPPVELKARDFRIPGDISSAAFFIAAAALLPGSELLIKGVGLNPTRTQFLRTLAKLGADVKTRAQDAGGMWAELDEASGDVRVRGSAGLAPVKQNESNVITGALVPQLIDELPMLAVVGTQVLGGLTIRDAAELRVKETDRIAATVENLRAMGAYVEEYEDGLTIPERTPLRGAKLKAHGDHRIAMAFSIAALLAEGESEIEGAECVGVSFPEFYGLLESVMEK